MSTVCAQTHCQTARLNVSVCQAADLKNKRKKLEEEDEVDRQTEVRRAKRENNPFGCAVLKTWSGVRIK